ncbi:Protein of unknown function [Gryllus bimaculatus]|nr:Protein of unknown function [Gryllus bimaculatus]
MSPCLPGSPPLASSLPPSAPAAGAAEVSLKRAASARDARPQPDGATAGPEILSRPRPYYAEDGTATAAAACRPAKQHFSRRSDAFCSGHLESTALLLPAFTACFPDAGGARLARPDETCATDSLAGR